jgi:hypothetical protein
VADGGPNDQEQTPAQRRFAASRVRPRVQVSRTPLPPPELPRSGQYGEQPYGDEPTGSPLFGQPREFAGGRVRVYGCSPGCIFASLAVSLLLSWLLTALFN